MGPFRKSGEKDVSCAPPPEVYNNRGQRSYIFSATQRALAFPWLPFFPSRFLLPRCAFFCAIPPPLCVPCALRAVISGFTHVGCSSRASLWDRFRSDPLRFVSLRLVTSPLPSLVAVRNSSERDCAHDHHHYLLFLPISNLPSPSANVEMAHFNFSVLCLRNIRHIFHAFRDMSFRIR